MKSAVRQTINYTNLNLMLLIKIIGLFIIFLNIAGFGFLLYQFGRMIKEKISPGEKISTGHPPFPRRKEPEIINDDIIPEEEDLLKDMDLSDLDNLSLDDFE